MGLGPAGPLNPLSTGTLPAFERLAGGSAWTLETRPLRSPRHVVLPIDATLGVAGLPQSGTGQATLFSGVNCAALVGRHLGPFPPLASKPVLAEQSVFARLLAAGYERQQLVFANAYPERFFARVRERERWTATTYCCHTAGIRLRTAEDVRAGRALTADLTGRHWPADVADTVPTITEADAAARLADLAAEHPFVLFEYYLTDKAGHAQDAEAAEALLAKLDRFFGALQDRLSDDTLLVVTSDHGNLEDLSRRGHPRQPVPLLAVGPGADAFANAHALHDVTPAIATLLTD